MNYPRIWVEIARILQLQIEFNYVVFVLTLILLYLTCCFFLLKRYPSPWILVLVFSGSSLFAIERGNSDLLIFSLLYGSAIAPIYAGAFLIFVGTALKIYPFLATIAFMKNKKVLLFLGVFICFCLYLMRDQFSLIKAGTPQSAWQSYGSLSVAGTLSQKLGILFNHKIITIMLVMIASILKINVPKIFKLKASDDDDAVSRLFLIGAATYVGTFVLASNFDYKLIFLILCLPYLFFLDGRFLRLAILTSIVLSSNYMLLTIIGGSIGLAVNIFAKCFVFVMLLVLVFNKTQGICKLRHPIKSV